MFDLRPAETRIAAALLEGRELLEIVRIYAVSRESIRSQLKSIFLKTGTRRQADLVALLPQVLQT